MSHEEHRARLIELFLRLMDPADFTPSRRWHDSPLRFLRLPSPAKGGNLAAAVLRTWLHGERTKSSDSDMRLNGRLYEIKSATVRDSGHVQFYQIRPGQKYDSVLCLGVFPHDIRGWVCSQQSAVRVGGNLHCGKADTRHVRFHWQRPPLGFAPRDGNLSDLYELIVSKDALPWR